MIFNLNAAKSLLFSIAILAASGYHRDAVADPVAPAPERSSPKPHADLSGRARTGTASFYDKKLAGKKMADGSKMNPGGDNAASKTLPLGTTASVTNVATGKSAKVTIKDRGPYAKNRIVDLSPSTAQKIGITSASGTAKVTVAPISVPLPDGSTKPGAATADTQH